jgi:hypothetical protein
LTDILEFTINSPSAQYQDVDNVCYLC